MPLKGRNPFTPLAAWERAGLVALLLLTLLFGGVVLARSAFMQRRMTDAGVYFRAAWALRHGQDPYTITDNNGWTYLYPPTLAAALAPLADPPKGEPRNLHLPYPVSIALWYAASVTALALSCHWLALAWARASRDPRTATLSPRQRRWWIDRLLPALVCIPAIGFTLSRGQVNTFVLLAVAGMALTCVRGRPFAAGAWLALAACLKLFPGLLLLVALWRRDWRMLLGFGAGCVALLLVLPALVAGPQAAVRHNIRLLETMILPHAGLTQDAAHAPKVKELQRAVDSQSIAALIHNARDFEGVRSRKRIEPTRHEKLAHVAVGAALLFATFFAARRRGKADDAPARADGETPLRTPAPAPPQTQPQTQPQTRPQTRPLTRHDAAVTLHLLGALTVLSIVLSPVSHLHYFALLVAPVTFLVGRVIDRGPTVDMNPRAWALLLTLLLCLALPLLPGLEKVKLLGLSAYAALGVWALCLHAAWLERRPAAAAAEETPT